MPKFIVRSRETRVYTWQIEAADEDEARDIVEEHGGDTTMASEDQYDSTEILDVVPA